MLQSRAFRTETTSESRKSLLFFFFVFSFVVRFCPPLRTFEYSHKVACTRRTDNSSRVFCPRCRPLYYPPPVQLYSSRSSGIFHFYILLFFFLTFVYPFCLLWTLCWLGCSLFFFWFCCCVGVVCEAGAWTAEARRCHRLSSRPCRGEDCRFLVFFFSPPSCLFLFLILSHQFIRNTPLLCMNFDTRYGIYDARTTHREYRRLIERMWRSRRDIAYFFLTCILITSHVNSHIVWTISYW